MVVFIKERVELRSKDGTKIIGEFYPGLSINDRKELALLKEKEEQEKKAKEREEEQKKEEEMKRKNMSEENIREEDEIISYLDLFLEEEKEEQEEMTDREKKGILLLHQFRKSKNIWEPYAKKLQREGYSVLTIDFRGHGESDGHWEKLKDGEEFMKMIEDARAGIEYLTNNKECELKTVIGASIGANTAFIISSEERVPAILLSPGLNYHGIETKEKISSAPVMIIVARGDDYSLKSSYELYENNLFGPKKLKIIPGTTAHGVYLLEKFPPLWNEIIRFLKIVE